MGYYLRQYVSKAPPAKKVPELARDCGDVPYSGSRTCCTVPQISSKTRHEYSIFNAVLSYMLVLSAWGNIHKPYGRACACCEGACWIMNSVNVNERSESVRLPPPCKKKGGRTWGITLCSASSSRSSRPQQWLIAPINALVKQNRHDWKNCNDKHEKTNKNPKKRNAMCGQNE